ncbi:hypothetical protein M2271_006207 [Streptomyces sp. LBL]|nr:hypothetical protein [Streptomyces sp. LBL]
MRPQFEAALALAREIKAHAPHCRVMLTVYEMKRLGRDAAELTALADHLTAHGLVLRRKGAGESVEAIQPDLWIVTGKRKGHHPSLASIYRALAEHEKARAYPEAVEQAATDFAALQHAESLPPPPARWQHPTDGTSPQVRVIRCFCGGYYGDPRSR